MSYNTVHKALSHHQQPHTRQTKTLPCAQAGNEIVQPSRLHPAGNATAKRHMAPYRGCTAKQHTACLMQTNSWPSNTPCTLHRHSLNSTTAATRNAACSSDCKTAPHRTPFDNLQFAYIADRLQCTQVAGTKHGCRLQCTTGTKVNTAKRKGKCQHQCWPTCTCTHHAAAPVLKRPCHSPHQHYYEVNNGICPARIHLQRSKSHPMAK